MKTKSILAAIILFVMGLQMALFAQETKTKKTHTAFQYMQHPLKGEGEINKLAPMPPMPPPVLPGIPDLSKEQSESIHALQLNVALTKFPLENNLREKEARLHSISTVQSPDLLAIDKQIEEIGSLMVELAKMQAAHDQAIRKLLNDEQRLIFDKRPPMPESRPF